MVRSAYHTPRKRPPDEWVSLHETLTLRSHSQCHEHGLKLALAENAFFIRFWLSICWPYLCEIEMKTLFGKMVSRLALNWSWRSELVLMRVKAAAARICVSEGPANTFESVSV